MQFPLPQYLKTRLIGWCIWVVNIVAWGTFAVLLLINGPWK